MNEEYVNIPKQEYINMLVTIENLKHQIEQLEEAVKVLA